MRRGADFPQTSPNKAGVLAMEISSSDGVSGEVTDQKAALPVPKDWRAGLAFGCLGLLAFSGTLPATRLAVPVFGPTILTCGRIEIAAVLGIFALCLMRGRRRPHRGELLGILWTGLGLAVGYPFFVALALEHVPSAHGAIVIGLAPAATAIISVVRTAERPPWRFWIGCGAGVLAVGAFAIYQGGGRIELADGWLVAAMLSVGFAYVEGGRVSREFGGTATLCWAMILLAPFAAIPLIIAIQAHAWVAIPWPAWAGFWYAGVISMFLGSVAWYRGLAAGGIARIGQLNLAQPLLALLWSAILLGERITWPFVVTAIVVITSMAICIKSRVVAVAPAGETRPDTR
jgi:drug/metabolite transporter (DMT)-like permease